MKDLNVGGDEMARGTTRSATLRSSESMRGFGRRAAVVSLLALVGAVGSACSTGIEPSGAGSDPEATGSTQAALAYAGPRGGVCAGLSYKIAGVLRSNSSAFGNQYAGFYGGGPWDPVPPNVANAYGNIRNFGSINCPGPVTGMGFGSNVGVPGGIPAGTTFSNGEIGGGAYHFFSVGQSGDRCYGKPCCASHGDISGSLLEPIEFLQASITPNVPAGDPRAQLCAPQGNNDSCPPSPNNCLQPSMCIPKAAAALGLGGGGGISLTRSDINALDGTNTRTVGCLSLGGTGKPITVGLMSSSGLWAQKLGMGGLPRGWTMNYTRSISIGTAPPSLYARGATPSELQAAAGPLVGAASIGTLPPLTYLAYLTTETGEEVMLRGATQTGPFYPTAVQVASPYYLDTSGSSPVLIYRDGTREEFGTAASTWGGGHAVWGNSYKLTSQTDLAGNKTTIDYGTAGKRIIRNERTGQKLVISLDGSGRPTSVADDAVNVSGTSPPAARNVAIAYHATGTGGTPSGAFAGLVSSVSDAAGATETYQYDTVGRLARECDKNNQCTTTTYAAPAQTFPTYPSAPSAFSTVGLVVVNGGPSNPARTVTVPILNTFNNGIGTTSPSDPTLVPYEDGKKALTQTSPDGTVSTFAWTPNDTSVTLNVTHAKAGQADVVERFLHYPTGAILRAYSRGSASAYTEIQVGDTGDVWVTVDPEGRKTQYGHDYKRALTQIIDPAGLTTNFVVDDLNRPIKITDPQGRVTDITYCTAVGTPTGCTAPGAVRTVIDRGADGVGANDRTTSFETNAAGQVTAAVLPDNTRNETTYNALGYPLSVIANKGTMQLVSSMVYNWRGDLTSVTDARGVTSTQTYDNMGRLLSQVSAVGTTLQSTTRYKYDNEGNLLRVLSDEGGVNRRTEMTYGVPKYMAGYLVSQVRDGMAGGDINSAWSAPLTTASMAYLIDGAPSSTTDALGRVTTTTYAYNADGTATVTMTPPGRGAVTRVTTTNKAGQVLTSVDELGVRTSYAYDAAGRPVTVTSGTQTTGSIPVAYTTTYDAQGRVSSVAGPSGYTQVPTYDTFGRVASQVESGLRWTSSTFDVMDRVVTSKAGNGAVANANVEATVATTYDGLGRVTTKTDNPGGLNLQTQYIYVEGSETDKVNLRRVVDPKGNITRYSYNAQGALAQTTDANSGVFTYTYDKLGRMILQSSPGNSQSFGYDALGRKTSASMNSGAAFPETWKYNADSTVSAYCRPSGGAACVSSSTSANGAWVYSYDAAGRMAGIDYPEVAGVTSADASYTYLANDLLASVTDANGKTAYTYDALNRVAVRARCSVFGCTPDVASDATANNKRLVYAYKANDTALASLQYWNRGSVSYATNALGQVTQLTDWAGNPTTYAYSGTGQLATANVNAGTAFTSTYAYDTARRLSRITHAKGAANLLDLRYDGFAAGENDFVGAQLAGRDANGNIRGIKETWRTEGALTHSFGYDTLNRLTGIKHSALPSGAWGTTGAPAVNVTNAYDARGNATSFMGKAFAYDTADRATTSGFAFDTNGNMQSSPSSSPTPSPSGKYSWGIWTCTAGTRTTDVKAYAMSRGIQSMDTTFTGTSGVIDANYSSTCKRTTPFSFVSPTSTSIILTTAASYTCSASCPAAVCTSGAQAGTVQNQTVSQSGANYTTTRTLDAVAVQGILGLAGCLPGDLETATLIKQ
jgi:YD repeat-containing protein